MPENLTEEERCPRMKRPGGKYILNDAGEPIPCDDLLLWGAWMESGDRILKQDFVEGEERTVTILGRQRRQRVGVSTVFLGLDHSFSETGPPVLWESMVFGTSMDGEMRRYSSREAALKGHAELVQLAREAYEKGGAGSPKPDTVDDRGLTRTARSRRRGTSSGTSR